MPKGIAHCELAAFSFWVFYDLFVHSIGFGTFLHFILERVFCVVQPTICHLEGESRGGVMGEMRHDCLRNIDHKRGSFQKFIFYSQACIFFIVRCQGFQGQITVSLKWFVKRTCQREEVTHNKPAEEKRTSISLQKGEGLQKQGQQSKKMDFNQKTCFTLLNVAQHEWIFERSIMQFPPIGHWFAIEQPVVKLSWNAFFAPASFGRRLCIEL